MPCVPLAADAPAPFGRLLQGHKLPQFALCPVAVAEAQQVPPVRGVLPAGVLHPHFNPAVVAKPLVQDSLKGVCERLVMISIHHDDIGQARFRRSLDQGQQRLAAHLKHLLEPAVPLERRAAGGRSARRIVVKDVPQEGDRPASRLVRVADRQEFARCLSDSPLGDVEVVIAAPGRAGREPPGVLP